jgi:CDP-diacylglycerol--glycerol-3-phosphate 3-phosphatidyltransferase
MRESAQVAIVALLGTAFLTSLVFMAAKPTPPARLAGRIGPIPSLGRWAYWVSRPFLRAIIAARISANGMTTIGVGLTLVATGFAAVGAWGWAGFVLVFGAWCDLFDGEIARQTGTQSPAGAFLDSNLDRISEIVLFAGFAVAFTDRLGVFWSFWATASSLMVSYARARGEGLGVACPTFGLERPHRVVMVMFALLAAAFVPEPHATSVMRWVTAAVAIGATATAAARMFVIHRMLIKAEPPKGAAAGAAPKAPVSVPPAAPAAAVPPARTP